MSICKGPRCGEEIRWVKGRKGGSIPIDVEPNPEGNVLIEGDGLAVVLPKEAAARYTGEKFMVHWKTCPDAESFRHKKRKPPVVAVLLGLLLLAGCATLAKMGVVDSEQDKYTYWTRYYETRMGLPPSRIVFEEHSENPWCSWVDAELELTGEGLVPVYSVVHYDIGRVGCKRPWDAARHEVCHLRYQHPYFRYSTDEEADAAFKETEVAKCEREYR